MKRIVLSLVITLLAVSLAPAAFAQCEPEGEVIIGGGQFAYDHIANGIPSSDSCWNDTNWSFVTGVTSCGWSTNAYQIAGLGASMHQQFDSDSGLSSNFSLQYLLDFIDPNNDGYWNKFKVEVWDVDTNTLLGSQTYNGSQSDLTCSSRTFNFNATPGNTIKVRFSGQKGYTDTYIRVHHIALYQYD
jgi:hypothetical protein